MSMILNDAEKYEEIMESLIADEARPEFHLTAPVGWMNDPNGFSYHNGQFHLFFQYYPYSCEWGPMHWGHAISSDLLHWRYLPVAIAPDSNADRDGCFSGTALWLPDGRQSFQQIAEFKRFERVDQRVNGALLFQFEREADCVRIDDGDAVGMRRDFERMLMNSRAVEFPHDLRRFEFEFFFFAADIRDDVIQDIHRGYARISGS